MIKNYLIIIFLNKFEITYYLFSKIIKNLNDYNLDE